MGFISKTIDKLTGADKAGKMSMKAAETAAEGYRKAGGMYEDAFADLAPELEGAYMEGAEVLSDAQRRALNFYQSQTALERQGGSAARKRLMGIAGLPGGEGTSKELINRAQRSPLYAAIMGSREAGEEAIMRNAAATGGLRSGNVQANMYDFNQRLGERALLESYNQELSGLRDIAGWEGNERMVAELMVDPYRTRAEGITQGKLAGSDARFKSATAMAEAEQNAAAAYSQGQIAAGQATMQGRGMVLGGLATLGASVWSDGRLKDEVVLLDTINGHNIYEWTWNAAANALGLIGREVGVMAHEVFERLPEAVGMREGYLVVNYHMLEI